jgi:hypothetical protein
MSRPTKRQIAAAAEILATDWDRDGTKAGGMVGAYEGWASGIADIIIHEPPPETLVDYLGVLEEQLCLPASRDAERRQWAARLQAAVRAATG